MPRHPRLFIPGAIYHVSCRVARGEFVFDDDFESIEFLETLREVRDLDGWSVLAWCLIGCHRKEAPCGYSQHSGSPRSMRTEWESVSSPRNTTLQFAGRSCFTQSEIFFMIFLRFLLVSVSCASSRTVKWIV